LYGLPRKTIAPYPHDDAPCPSASVLTDRVASRLRA